MTSNYNALKIFVNTLEEKYNFNKKDGKKIINDFKKNKKRRCPCRILHKTTLNINNQCPNAVYTINNKCYSCNKNNTNLGNVNVYPNQYIIDMYYKYSKQINIYFNINCVNIGRYNKYFNPYIKIKITDIETCTTIVLFKIPNGNYGDLIDKYFNHVGIYETWLDYNNIYSNHFKNDKNEILDPIHHIPLLKYSLEEKSIYHTLTNRIYKKYRFNSNKEALLLTNDVLDN